MGLNAYFTYQVVGFHGTGSISYQLALAAVFVEGFTFVFLSLIGMRQWLVKLIPSSLKVAGSAGIGIFCGGILTAWLMMYKVKSAMIIGIALVSILSWPRATSFTYFPYTQDGDDRFEFFKKVVTFHPIQHTLAVAEWNLTNAGPKFALALF